MGIDHLSDVLPTFISYMANPVLYGLAANILSEDPSHTGCAVVYGLTESIVRFLHEESVDDSVDDPLTGSLPGKVLSLPVEWGISLYERSKEESDRGNEKHK